MSLIAVTDAKTIKRQYCKIIVLCKKAVRDGIAKSSNFGNGRIYCFPALSFYCEINTPQKSQHENKNRWEFACGILDEQHKRKLVVQINSPKGKEYFPSRAAGIFLAGSNGDISIAHSGYIYGRSQEFMKYYCEAVENPRIQSVEFDGSKASDYIIVADIDSCKLIEQLVDFVRVVAKFRGIKYS